MYAWMLPLRGYIQIGNAVVTERGKDGKQYRRLYNRSAVKREANGTEWQRA
jgi:hypothetical protein